MQISRCYAKHDRTYNKNTVTENNNKMKLKITVPNAAMYQRIGIDGDVDIISGACHDY